MFKMAKRQQASVLLSGKPVKANQEKRRGFCWARWKCRSIWSKLWWSTFLQDFDRLGETRVSSPTSSDFQAMAHTRQKEI